MAHHAHVFAPHEFFEPIAFVGAGHWARFRVAKKGERNLILVDEFGVGCSTVFADTKHLDVIGLEAFPLVSEIAGFLRAARGVVLRIEVDHNPLTS